MKFQIVICVLAMALVIMAGGSRAAVPVLKVDGSPSVNGLQSRLPIVNGSSKYCKPDFGFVATVPDDWRVYAERKDEGRFIVSFGLPLVWSEIEKQKIENDVSVTAYRRIDISSVKRVVEFEEKRVKDILVSRKEVPSAFGKAFVVITKIRGLQYKTLLTCHFVNDFGYSISFTATEGTYDINLGKYSDFLAAMVFVPVDEKKN